MADILLYIILPAVVAALVVRIVHPTLVSIAFNKKIVDIPNARKLNVQPVPVLGGVGVYMGVILSVATFASISGYPISSLVFVCVTFMFMVGLIDDIQNTAAIKKLMLQILMVCMLMFLGGYKADNLHGLWGFGRIPDWLAYPITLIAAVGLMNAINMIDGVDGLSSGYGMIASILCGIYFFHCAEPGLAIFAFAVAGALVPFFFFNVFSRKYKMFIGDAGALLLGAVFSYFCIEMVQSPPSEICNSGVIAFVFAVFALPIMDTLRVMFARMLKGRSPFSPDKTHLHHIFIDMGYSHIGTTFRVLLLSLLPVAVWFLTDKLGISIDMQFYAVILAGLLITCGVYYFFAFQRKRNPAKYAVRKERLTAKNTPKSTAFGKIRKVVDNK